MMIEKMRFMRIDEIDTLVNQIARYKKVPIPDVENDVDILINGDSFKNILIRIARAKNEDTGLNYYYVLNYSGIKTGYVAEEIIEYLLRNLFNTVDIEDAMQLYIIQARNRENNKGVK